MHESSFAARSLRGGVVSLSTLEQRKKTLKGILLGMPLPAARLAFTHHAPPS